MASRQGLRHKRIKPTEHIGERTATPAPKIDHLRMTVMDVTPEQAAVWLEGKCPNRGVSDAVVNRYARDMLAGAWHLNGETIVFDTEGALLDGQHRLWAVINSGVTVKMAVAFGASKDSMTTFDMGRNRTFGDVLTIKGLKNTNTLSGAARWMFWYDNIRKGQTISGATHASHDELMETIAKHPLLMSAAQMVDAKNNASRIMSKSILAFVVAGALERDPDKANTFLSALASGVGLTESDPVFRLRERMITDRASTTKLDRMTIAAYAVKAWNYHYLDRPLGALKWDRTSKKPEAFPSFVD